MKTLKSVLIVLFFTIFSLIGVFFFFGLTVNLTESMPLGFYQFSSSNNVDIVKNDLVIFNIPEKSEQLLKRVIAAENDHIVVNQDGVFLNSVLIPNSKIFYFDSKGHPLTPKFMDRTLTKNEIFAMGEHIQSYDSRYFGIVHVKENNIRKVHLLFTWSSHNG